MKRINLCLISLMIVIGLLNGFITIGLNNRINIITEDQYLDDTFQMVMKPVEVAFANCKIDAGGYNAIAERVWDVINSHAGTSINGIDDWTELQDEIQYQIEFYHDHIDDDSIWR